MPVGEGEKVHVAERRSFDVDVRRHFVGQVEKATPHALRVKGWVYVFDSGSSSFLRHPEVRTRIISLTDARLIINVLPDDADLENSVYEINERGVLSITDGKNFSLTVSEFGFRR